MVGLEARESLYTHRRSKEIFAGQFSVRRFLAMLQALDAQALDTQDWLPGLGNLADGLSETTSDRAPLLRLLEPPGY